MSRIIMNNKPKYLYLQSCISNSNYIKIKRESEGINSYIDQEENYLYLLLYRYKSITR